MKIIRNGGVLLIASLATASCSESTGPNGLDDAVTLDVAMMAAEATLDDVQNMTLATWGIAGPQAVPGFAGGGGMAPGDVLERSRSRSFFGVGMVPMDHYDPLETDVIVTVMDVTGTVSRDHWSASITRHREKTVSGLVGEETQRTWNGTGTSLVSQSRHSDEHGDRTRTMSSSTTIENVVVGVPRSENPWPLSGTIHKVVEVTTVTPDGTRNHMRTVTIVFNGTQFAVLTVNDETFELDLANRRGDRPRRTNGGG